MDKTYSEVEFSDNRITIYTQIILNDVRDRGIFFQAIQIGKILKKDNIYPYIQHYDLDEVFMISKQDKQLTSSKNKGDIFLTDIGLNRLLYSLLSDKSEETKVIAKKMIYWFKLWMKDYIICKHVSANADTDLEDL